MKAIIEMNKSYTAIHTPNGSSFVEHGVLHDVEKRVCVAINSARGEVDALTFILPFSASPREYEQLLDWAEKLGVEGKCVRGADAVACYYCSRRERIPNTFWCVYVSDAWMDIGVYTFHRDSGVRLLTRNGHISRPLNGQYSSYDERLDVIHNYSNKCIVASKFRAKTEGCLDNVIISVCCDDPKIEEKMRYQAEQHSNWELLERLEYIKAFLHPCNIDFDLAESLPKDISVFTYCGSRTVFPEKALFGSIRTQAFEYWPQHSYEHSMLVLFYGETPVLWTQLPPKRRRYTLHAKITGNGTIQAYLVYRIGKGKFLDKTGNLMPNKVAYPLTIEGIDEAVSLSNYSVDHPLMLYGWEKG